MGLLDKAKDLVGKNKDKVAQGVDRATDAVDRKTGGKHTEHLEKVDQAARDYANEPGTGKRDGAGTNAAGGTTPTDVPGGTTGGTTPGGAR